MQEQPGDDQDWQRLMAGVRGGDQDACRQFWDQYGPLIERVAQRHLSPGVRRRVGPDSIVLSACRTFFRRAQGGEFQLSDATGLGQLLCAITVNKVRMKTRCHLRQRRGLQAEQHPAELPEAVARGPRPEDLVAFDDELQLLVSQFDDEERHVLDLKLQELTNEEVAEKIGSSERTVRRIVKRLQSHMARLLGQGDGST
jgi:RNA polymerase sigma-70 factor, ECF subfamily